MTNSTKTTRYSVIFLAAMLVAGTIVAFTPSFLVGSAQAESYYNDINKEKNFDRNVSVQSLKCNNINVNVNGLELDVFPPFLGGDDLAAEAQDANTNSNSFAGNSENSEINDFRFICINNNNNTVIEAPIPAVNECPEADEIESCFRQFLLDALFPNFVDALESGITVEIDGQDVTLRSFEDICEALEGLTTFVELRFAVESILQEALGFVPMNIEFFFCIAEALGIPLSHG